MQMVKTGRAGMTRESLTASCPDLIRASSGDSCRIGNPLDSRIKSGYDEALCAM
jgi:hypothetical protein